ARLRLDNPWTIFYGLLVVAGVTNYLPTRYGPAAAWLGLGFLLEYLGLTRAVGSVSGRAVLWTAVPWTLAAAVLTAEGLARRPRVGSSRLERVWSWFCDHWGVVWALRVMERFNRTADAQRWPIRLAWRGFEDAPGKVAPVDRPGSVPEEALAVLSGLLRRFATPERVDRAAGAGDIPPCRRGDGLG